MAEVEDAYGSLFEAHGDIASGTRLSVQRAREVRRTIEADRVGIRESSHVVADVWHLYGTEWLALIVHDVKPGQLHEKLGVVRRLPQHYLVTLM